MQQRIVWEDLPEDTRTAIQARTGPIEQACAVSEGTNSALAAVLHSCAGRVFVKGIRTDHPSVAAQQREAAINPHVRTLAVARAPVAPRRRRRMERPWAPEEHTCFGPPMPRD